MSGRVGLVLLALCALLLWILGRMQQQPEQVQAARVRPAAGFRTLPAEAHGLVGFDSAVERQAQREERRRRRDERNRREGDPAGALGQEDTSVPAIVANARRNAREHERRAIDATTPVVAHSIAPAAAPRAYRLCAPGCVENGGVCNTELGRCDCPPFVGGEACTQPLLPACSALVGMRQRRDALVASPCLIDGAARAPVSCECLMGCESLGLMGVRECYVTDPSNGTTMEWVRRQRGMRGLEANLDYFSAALKTADADTKCSGHGVFAPPMPLSGPPLSTHRPGCICYPGWGGASCEHSTAVRDRRFCLNGCSQLGRCYRNWCQCDRGFFGIDCSLGSPPPGAPPAVALPPPIGAQDGRWAAGAPRIYVYELPPRFNSWLQAGSHGWWQDMDLWGEDVVIHRRALRSAYRVTDPEQADLFLVPIHVSSGMWQLNWGFRDLLPTGVRVHQALLAYLRATWPFFDRRKGSDHLWVWGHDQGAWRVRAKLPALAPGVFINVFGAGPAQRGGHLPGHDIVCPPVLYSGVPSGLLNHAGRQRVAAPPLAFFQGKLNLHIPYEYSFGIRQGLYKAFRTKGTILVREGHEANRERYFELMSASKFCVAAAGFGFSTRVYESATAGCVPLIMMDGVESAYEELLPYHSFALRLNDSLKHLLTLEAVLAAVPAAAVAAMRARLRCVWPRFLWLRHDEGAVTPLPEQQRLLRYDAFETLLWTIRKRLRRDVEGPPDWDEACGAVRDYFQRPPRGAPASGWAPWANWKDLPEW
eukprot:scaffold9715_cov113-Isochrysis_galbana.AAC.20